MSKNEEIQKILKELASRPVEPFEKGGFLTGRGFVDHEAFGKRFRAVGNELNGRPLDETFHLFLLRRFVDIVGGQWLEDQKVLPSEEQHPLSLWFEETRIAIEGNPQKTPSGITGLSMTGNMRALLAIAYDFYSLHHCQARVLPKLLNRLKDKRQFQGARYEIAVGGLVVRSGFLIEWVNDEDKHCEFVGKHKITGDRAAFEAKSHHRDGVLGFTGTVPFDPASAKVKVLDHIKEALEQSPKDIPLIIFDDLNLPLTPDKAFEEKQWFTEVEAQLKLQQSSFSGTQYGALILTNFSWHFDASVPKVENEIATHFHTGGPFSLKFDTITTYLVPAGKQYGIVPPKAEEFESIRLAQSKVTDDLSDQQSPAETSPHTP